jgi:predicted Zn-ribbon and HTH transcriptional regulator
MLDNTHSQPENDLGWLDVELPGPDEFGREPFDDQCRCHRCGHSWEKRVPFGQWPSACPGCKSPRWYRPPEQKGRPSALSTITDEEMHKALDRAASSLDWVLTASPKQMGRELRHPSHQCLRCMYKWHKRGDPKNLPRACPSCRSPRWFVPRVKKTG